jgi:hypothetical protein
MVGLLTGAEAIHRQGLAHAPLVGGGENPRDRHCLQLYGRRQQ